MSNLNPFIATAVSGKSLTEAEAESAFEIIMSGEASAVQIASFLTALAVRGETVAEITGAARIMRAKALPVKAPPGAIDTCGTGGDASGTVNISTAVAIVVAACGVPVAKHGNRKASSKSGTADVLEALGVNLDAPPNVVERAITETNIGFLFAQKHHSAMKHVGPVRAELGIRTLFNLLGPLSNPAGAKRQLLGVFAADWVTPIAETLNALGSERAWVVHGSDGLDELTVTGASTVAELKNGEVSTFEVSPQDAGLSTHDAQALKGGDPEDNAKALSALLDGAAGAYRDIVLLNAAAALLVADKVDNLETGASLAAAAIDKGDAKATLAKFAAITQGET
ncbi:MAG: anthranilate phosphoribosyltransferase [Alphaproteobacteria bacterium]|nr:anthranilate phosphoribosyltransferase [Alphaproteobacteria bacterium]